MTATAQLLRRRPALLASALATLALAGGLAFGAQGAAPGQAGPERPVMDGSRRVDRLLDQVGAAPEQRSEIRAIVNAAREELRAPRATTKALRADMAKLFAQPSVDANAVEALRQQLLVQHDQTSQRWTQALLEISRVLTPEQRQRAAELMTRRHAMLQRHRAERGSLDAALR